MLEEKQDAMGIYFYRRIAARKLFTRWDDWVGQAKAPRLAKYGEAI